MTLKILHVLDHSAPLHSGYTFRTLAILREQSKLGWKTFHLTSPKHHCAVADAEVSAGFKFYRTRVNPKGWRAWPLLDQFSVISDTRRRLDEVISVTKPDLVHAHSPCLNGIAAVGAARARRLPVVYEMRASWEDAAVDHGSTREGSLRYRASRELETWVLRRADAVTTICEGLRRDILQRRIDPAQVTVIPNGVDLERFPFIAGPNGALLAQLGLGSGPVLGFLGSFYGYEGLDLLISALPQIRQVYPNVKLLLVGGGPEENSLASQVQRLGLEDSVMMIGRVPHEEVQNYYSLIDMLVFPRKSIRLTETVTPLKPLEAMAQGLIVMASNVGGHRELIRDGETGFLFAPDSPAAIAAAVGQTMSVRDRWGDIRKKGREFVEQERSWAASVARYPAVYEAAMRRQGPS
jgi:PEP-CTERM/exosortase A-associated glycosyltransferase